MKFSVLICTYNRPQHLTQCLDALICGTTEKPDQVVVVNGGDERSDAVVNNFAEVGRKSSVIIELVKTVNKNPSTSRNVGLPYCTGDIVAMTDDDAEVYPDWVAQMKRLHIEHPEAGGVGGPVMGADTLLVSRISDRTTFAKHAQSCYVRTLPTVNISYKRAVIDTVGDQDERLSCGEDVDYNWRVKKLGYEIYYDPVVRVQHHHRNSVAAFLRQHHNYGRGYYLVRRKWPEMYCVYPHSLRRPKDLLKAMNFFAAVFYEPLLIGARMERFADKLLAVPIIFLCDVGWRGGMLRQKWLALSTDADSCAKEGSHDKRS